MPGLAPLNSRDLNLPTSYNPFLGSLTFWAKLKLLANINKTDEMLKSQVYGIGLWRCESKSWGYSQGSSSPAHNPNRYSTQGLSVTGD